MRWKRTSALLAGAMSAALAAGTFGVSTAGAAQASASPAPAGHWGAAERISLGSVKGSNEAIQKISCPSPGNCTAVGTYLGSTSDAQVFVVSEVNGGWGKASLIPGLNAASKGLANPVDALSCASPGNCALGGSYLNANGDSQPFVADSVNGHWGPAHILKTIDSNGLEESVAKVTSVSCSKPGDCSAGVTLPDFISEIGGGTVQVIPAAFVAREASGTWSAPQPVPAFTGMQPPSAINSISCWSPGNCVAGGFSSDASGHAHALTVSDDGGTWQTAQLIPGFTSISDYNPNADAEVTSVSCPGGDDCSLAGTYHDETLSLRLFVADVGAHGNFHPQTVPGSDSFDPASNSATVSLLSCGAPGNCAFAGVVAAFSLSPHPDLVQGAEALVDTEAAGNGAWGTAQPLPGITAGSMSGPESLSCGGAGSCIVGGFHTFDSTDRDRAFVAEESSGTWGAVRRVAGNLDAGDSSQTNAVSCASPGNCAAGGFYTDAAGHQLPFVIDESSVTTTTLSLSAAKVKAGHEQSERLSVQVKPRTSGTPAGQVTIKAGSARLCVISLAKGKGACTLTARKLRPGTYHLTATYPGGTGYAASTSAKKTLTVTKASVALTSTTQASVLTGQ